MAPTPVLATKLFAPARRPRLVARPRLAERLDTTLDAGHRLTLVSAPAGFGKTTLLSDWLTHLDKSRTDVRVAWLSLDDGDNDLARLLTHLVAALQSAGLDVDGAVLASLPTASTSAVLTALVNDVTGAGEHTPDQRWMLVLDDYHAIEATGVHDAVTFLLDHLPGHLHLVIATRSDPPLPLARLRSRGQLTELRAAACTPRVTSSTSWTARSCLPTCGWPPAGPAVPAGCTSRRCCGEPYPRATADLYVGLAELDRELDDLASAEAHLETARVLGERDSITENRHRWSVAMAQVRAAGGDHDAARHLLDRAEAMYRRGFYPDIRPIAAMKARVRIAAGELSSASEWAHDPGVGVGVGVDDDPDYLREYEHLTLARLLLAQAPSAAPIAAVLGLLDRMRAAAAHAGRDGSLLEIGTLQALAQHAGGDLPRALAVLHRSFAETPEPESYVRLYWTRVPRCWLFCATLLRTPGTARCCCGAGPDDSSSGQRHRSRRRRARRGDRWPTR